MLLGLRAVDFVCDLGRRTLIEFLRAVVPDVHVVGPDEGLSDRTLAEAASLGVRIQLAEPSTDPVSPGRRL